MNETLNREKTVKRWSASLGTIGAVLASACCVLPLAFLMLGISGAWIGNLTALEPYKEIFSLIALVFLGAGFWQVYFKPNRACATDGYCATPRADTIMKIILWFSTLLVIVALTIDYWAPVIEPYL